MIKEFSNFTVYNFPGNKNAIYYKITSITESKSCYPDILFNHNLTEEELISNEAYNIASELIKKRGPSRCIFLSCDEATLELIIESLDHFYTSSVASLDDGALISIKKLSKDLALSVTMESAFINLMTYQSIQENIMDYIDNIRAENILPVTSKSQGKIIYERIRKDIIG